MAPKRSLAPEPTQENQPGDCRGLVSQLICSRGWTAEARFSGHREMKKTQKSSRPKRINLTNVTTWNEVTAKKVQFTRELRALCGFPCILNPVISYSQACSANTAWDLGQHFADYLPVTPFRCCNDSSTAGALMGLTRPAGWSVTGGGKCISPLWPCWCWWWGVSGS